jgi:D-alanyl-lipoteichoic acid acyltransferase DltB (MBOAT superfamily)
VLFNSSAFIFGFAPLVLIFFLALGRFDRRWALGWLLAASLFFYGWWNPRWLPLLVISVVFNFGVGRALGQFAAASDHPGPARPGRSLLIAAIGVNLALLVYFKYLGFLSSVAAAVLGLPIAVSAPELPLGISFFTFTQIAFLVDVHLRRAAEFDPLRYGLFVTYYPHLIAGPILHHAEMMPQFARPEIFRFNPGWLADGCVVFVLGLFKKAVLADQFARYANAGFNAAGSHPLSFFESWGAALSYTLQLYFDFSGYSDMAIGLALMIGVQLPLNFRSPYKSLNIAEFWRRWHMTLSRFLRDYLYIPLGGNRHGPARRYVNLMVTMLLGGLWHGAGWTFVVWGGLHGLLLVVHGLWRQLLEARAPGWAERGVPGTRALSWLLTFTAVVVGWVFFRAADLPTALSMLQGMLGQHGSLLPEQIVRAVPPLGWLADGVPKVPYLGDGSVMGSVEIAVMLAMGLSIAVFAPALHELRNRARYALVVPCGALAVQQVLYGRASEFLYFQF